MHTKCTPSKRRTGLKNREMIARYGIREMDACRLIAEGIENLGTRAQNLSERELICLLRRVIQQGIDVEISKQNTVTFGEAARQSIEARHNRRAATLHDLRYFTRRMMKLDGVAHRPLRAMTTTECRNILAHAFGNSRSSYRKGRSILHSIFSFGYYHEWCDSNPVDRIPSPRVQEQEILPLRLKEINKLKNTANLPPHHAMKLSLHLMLYCGIRPAEVQRINPETDINWDEEAVYIRPRNSKTGGGRVVPLRCKTWLSATDQALVIPQDWQKRWKQLRRQAGFRRWVPDVLRHTFASYHARFFQNLSQLQLEMGHTSPHLLNSRYLNPTSITLREAKQFWLRS